MRILLRFVLPSCLACCSAGAQESVLPTNGLAAFTLQRPDSSYAAMTLLPVSGQTFTQAVRVATLKQPPSNYSIQLNVRTTAAVASNDVLLATFYIRRVASTGSDAFTEFVFEQAGTPYTKSATRTFNEGAGTWQPFHVAFKSVTNYAAGGVQINFRLGYEPQTIELGGISVTNYLKTVTLESLPNDFTYVGRDTNAAWRAAAAARIEQYRKADLTVTVQDQFGQRIPGASVQVNMQRHAFGFGSAVAASGLLGTSTNDTLYRDTIKRLFNKAVMENDLKWPQWEGNRTRATNGVDWLRAQGIAVRGHTLIWPSWGNMPADVRMLTNNLPALRNRINLHLTEEATALRGRLVEWDVINETYSNHDVMDLLGDAEMVTWFQRTRAADPQSVLYLNDYGILSVNSTNDAHQNAYFNTINYLLTNGAPMAGVGLQSHFGSNLTPPPRLWEILNRFASFPVDLQSTEFDIDITDEQTQADYTRDFMTLLFSHPKVVGIVMWGFWEGRHWKPAAAMFRRDWSIKPNGLMWQDLVFRQWWTTANGRADNDGNYTARGFKGTYAVTGSLGSVSNTVSIVLASNQTCVVTLSNLPPTLWLLSPTNLTVCHAGTVLPLRVALAGYNGAVSQVEFFRGAQRIGISATAPFQFDWPAKPIGNHALTAVARLAGGSSASSSIVNLTVVEGLTAQCEGDHLVLRWPLAPTGFAVVAATNLAAPVFWSPVTATVVTNSNQQSLSLPIETGARFFRLQPQ
jgi:GH35 family endo-1,4-beta-xylanase